jgi:hypothetical protein
MRRTLLVTALLAAATLLSAPADAQTHCQRHGHGASGCPLTSGDAAGYCWSKPSSPTGYVCKPLKPSAAPAKRTAPPPRDKSRR